MKNSKKQTSHFFKLIKLINIFGYHNELKIKGKSCSKIQLGGLLTFIMLSFTAIL